MHISTGGWVGKCGNCTGTFFTGVHFTSGATKAKKKHLEAPFGLPVLFNFKRLLHALGAHDKKIYSLYILLCLFWVQMYKFNNS